MKLGYRPALDGIRGIAILAVIGLHTAFAANSSVLPGGHLGVVMFFTLSGFLITTLLLERSEKGLGRFYLRRVARLFPALAVALVGYTLFLGLVDHGRGLGGLVPSLLYFENFRLAYSHVPWNVEPLNFAWSLSIEEQFYLLWPALLLLLLRRPRWITPVVSGLIVASVLARMVTAQHGFETAFTATQCRADALLVGCLLAWWAHRSPELLSRQRGRLAVGCSVVLGLLILTESNTTPATFVFGMTLAALATAGLIAAGLAGGRTGVALSWRPLVGVGRISYSLYLLQPLAALLTEHYLPAGPVQVTSLPVAFVMAYGSWRFVEVPARRRIVALADRRRPAVVAVPELVAA